MVRQQEGSWTKRQKCYAHVIQSAKRRTTSQGPAKKKTEKNGGCFLHASQQEDGRKYHTHVCRAARQR